jgi:hypothetical protein
MDKLWESMFLDKFPNSSKNTILEAKREAAVDWAYDNNTEMARMYDKYVMFKRLQGIQPDDSMETQ